MRLDKYLKVSRLIKRRTVANDACDNERVMVNPSNGKRMLVPPKITMNFKVSNVLKARLKNQV